MSRRTDARAFFAKWRADYDFKTIIGSTGSMLATAAFAAYNGFLGAVHASPWHGGICVYYILLLLLRLLRLLTTCSTWTLPLLPLLRVAN